MEIETTFTQKKNENLRKYRVIVYHFDGKTNTEISQLTGFPKGTVTKLLNKFNTYGDILFNCYVANGGRPQKLGDDDKMVIEDALHDNNAATLVDLQKLLFETTGKQVSLKTINTYENQIGKFKLPIEKPVLSSKNMDKRLEYALCHQEDTFSNVVFTDESYFTLNRNTKKIFVFNGEETPQAPFYNPDSGIMVWGAISKKGKIAFEFVEESIDRYVYLDILERNFPHNADRILGKRKWRFQQDNAPAHRAIIVREWLEDNVPKRVHHPPQSPDFNPIEMVWGWMKDYIERKGPSNMQELKAYILEAWDGMSLELINRFIEHLPTVIGKVIEKNGDNVI